MKPFSALLAVLVVAGVGWLVWASQERTGPRPAAQTPAPVAAADGFKGYTLGSDAAPVEVVEYADFQCPHCGEFAVLQLPAIREQLIATGKVRWRLRDFPLNFPWSRLSALAAQCAGEQGKFWPMADTLFLTQSEWGRSSRNPSGFFRGLARGLRLDRDQYDACMESARYTGRIEASRQEGEARGVTGTPTFFVNGRPWPDEHNIGSDRFQQVVDSVLAAKPKR